MKQMITWAILVYTLFSYSCGKSNNSNKTSGDGSSAKVAYFTNPLLSSGPDPWVVMGDDQNYYVTYTAGASLKMYQTAKMSLLNQAALKTVWTPPVTGSYSHDIWAPEMHHLQNNWYMYFAADNGNDTTHRIYVLQCSGPTPFSSNWTFMGQIQPKTDRWAIDPTVFTYNDNLYMAWSGWAGYNQPGNQQIYVAKMQDALTLSSDRVLISKPDQPWEKNGSPVNEGPEVLTNAQGRLFLIYSASSCFTDDYCLGLLTLKSGGDPLNPADWTKSPSPVFTKNAAGNTFGPGHCSFFKSKDGSEDWIIFHANSQSGQGCGDTRNPRMEKFSWSTDGTPDFGEPVAAGLKIKVPSGE